MAVVDDKNNPGISHILGTTVRAWAKPLERLLSGVLLKLNSAVHPPGCPHHGILIAGPGTALSPVEASSCWWNIIVVAVVIVSSSLLISYCILHQQAAWDSLHWGRSFRREHSFRTCLCANSRQKQPISLASIGRGASEELNQLTDRDFLKQHSLELQRYDNFLKQFRLIVMAL